MIRTVFGWRPTWAFLRVATTPADVAAAIDAALFLPAAPRPDFDGTLAGIRTPYGAIDLAASESGVSWSWTS